MRKFIASRWWSGFGLKISRNQSRAFIEREVGPRPLKEHDVQIGHGSVPANRSHVAFVPIPESLRFTSFNHRQNVARGVTALLHGDWRHAWQRLSSLVRKICQVADYLNLRTSRNRKIIVEDHATNIVDWHAK